MASPDAPLRSTVGPTEQRDPELERFGPWVDEVRTPEALPRLFRDHPVDLDAARLVLAVPRDLPRRDAVAGMDLYDHLLVLTEDRFTVLSRPGTPLHPVSDGHAYGVLEVRADDVVAVRESVDLLAGRLTVHLRGGAVVDLPFNGSSRATITRLTDLLRGGSRPATAASSALAAAARAEHLPAPLDPGRQDLALAADAREAQRRNPDLVPWACHGRTPLTPQGTGLDGAVQRVLHALSPMTLQGAVLLADDVALEVHGRHGWLLRGSRPVHSSSRLVVPFGALDAVELAGHARYPDLVLVALHVGGHVIELAVPARSAAHRILAGAVG